MSKAILFDVDGIVIEPRKQFFSERLAEKQGISKEAVQKFFLHDFKKCSFGTGDLKVEIAPYLSEWKWEGSVDDLLTYWFESESTKDEVVLKAISTFRNDGIKCYIATRQEKYRLRYLLDTVGLKEYFDDYFSSCDIGYDKTDPKFYEYILNELNLNSSEVLFFDDSLANIQTALSFGIESYLYEDVETLNRIVLQSQH